MLFTYALDARVFIYLSVAFNFEHTIKNFAVPGLKLESYNKFFTPLFYAYWKTLMRNRSYFSGDTR